MRRKTRKLREDPPAWLKALKQTKIDIDQLSLKQLKDFKDFDRYLNQDLPENPEERYIVYSFRNLTFFALSSIYDNQFLPLTKCWNELNTLFLESKIFEDEVFVQSWIFCDFPLDRTKTLLQCFSEFTKKSGSDYFQVFSEQMKKTRFGLYQEIFTSSTIIKFRELFTGAVIEAVNTIPEYEKGEIFLTRFIEINGKTYNICDPKCWPQEYKSALEEMIAAKLFYFDGPTTQAQYEKFMKLAGPYWMSCVNPDQNAPILSPDHYLSYFKE